MDLTEAGEKGEMGTAPSRDKDSFKYDKSRFHRGAAPISPFPPASPAGSVRPNPRKAFPKSGMVQTIQQSKSHFFRHGGRTDTGWTSVVTRTQTDQLMCRLKHLIAYLVKRSAETDATRKIVVNENRGMK